MSKLFYPKINFPTRQDLVPGSTPFCPTPQNGRCYISSFLAFLAGSLFPQSFTKHKAASFTRTQMPHGFSVCGSCRCGFSELACIILRLWPIPDPERRYPGHILPRYTLDAEKNSILLLLIMPMDTRSEDKWYCHHIGYGCSLRNEKEGYDGYEDIKQRDFFGLIGVD